MKDNFGNMWEIKNEREVFSIKDKSITGGILGTVIGVKNMDESMKVYQDILQYDEVVYDKTGVFEDFAGISGGDHQFRRVLLKHSDVKIGAFSPFFGRSVIELVQVTRPRTAQYLRRPNLGRSGFYPPLLRH
jgi:hypothetical protein